MSAAEPSASLPPAPVNHALRGMILMVATTACASLLQTSTKAMPGAMPSQVIVFFRSAFGLLWLMPWLLWRGPDTLRTRKPHLHVLRALLNLGSMSFFFAGVTMTPLAQVAVIGFTSPLFGAVLVVVLLREHCPPRRWVAMGIGLAATILVIQPHAGELGTGPVLLLCGEFLWGFVLVTVKALSRSDSSLTITFWLSLIMTPLAAIPAAFVWVTPTGEQWLWLALIGALGTASQLLMAQSFRDADVTAVVPLSFTELIWSALLGWLVFAETPDAIVIAGGLVIFLSSAYLSVREGR